MLQQARDFFAIREVLEVDCPIISQKASIDAHIDLIPCKVFNKQAWLHSSPEYGMKRLLAEEIGDIYQLSHVFRDFECGIKHNPEFMMAEWYRVGFTFNQMIEETCAFIKLFVGNCPVDIICYQEAFLKYTGLDPFASSFEDLAQYITRQGCDSLESHTSSKDDLLTFILATFIEPKLGSDVLSVLAYFPPSQAALSQVCTYNGHKTAERFEVFYQGLELANGYHELQDPQEQRKRLLEANAMRKALGKDMLVIDENFLEALEKGLPDCCGVAVGFDRLMMLHMQTNNISDVLPFDWSCS